MITTPGDLSYSTVRDYVARRRPEIWAEANRSAGEVFVPQDHAFGAEGEVDFADLWVILRGVKTKTHLFTFRLSASGRSAFPRIHHTRPSPRRPLPPSIAVVASMLPVVESLAPA